MLIQCQMAVQETLLIDSLEVEHMAPVLWFYLSTHSGSVASSVWVLALALISLLLETEQTEPHHEVVLKSTQFC